MLTMFLLFESSWENESLKEVYIFDAVQHIRLQTFSINLNIEDRLGYYRSRPRSAENKVLFDRSNKKLSTLGSFRSASRPQNILGDDGITALLQI